jgi:uncharacterized repeat protein (TIGR03843 family)
VPPLELSRADLAEVLEHGQVELVGRMRYSSNGAFFVHVCVADVDVPAVYKPRRGERPLWDFPDGTLWAREVAACRLSDGLGWDVVPVTVARHDAPLGEGALQRFVEHDPEDHYFTLLSGNEDRFRQFAAFDILANNTDRKGGHCLYDSANDVIVGIDHGLTFHPHWKLRTVIWDFADERLPDDLAADVGRVASELETGDLGAALAELLSPPELAAIGVRAGELLRDGHFPTPEPGYHSVPWPMV